MKWAVRPGLVFLLIVLGGRFAVMIASQTAVDSLLKSFLPSNALGWKAEAKDAAYDRETIFQYIDGAGEVYRAYNFERLLSRRFVKQSQPDLVVDLFDMGSSYDAFGIFSNDLEGEEAGLGQGSTYNGGLLAFWKDRYFVSVSAERETDETKAALFSLGSSIAAAVKKEGPKPPLLALLPAEFAGVKSVRYFHSHILLNRHFFISHDDILNLARSSGAVFSKPRMKDETGILLLIEYPETKLASEAYANFVRIYMPEAGDRGIVRTEDKTWTAARLRGRLIAIVFHAPSDKAATGLLKKIEANFK
jgi:hypothetical protein